MCWYWRSVNELPVHGGAWWGPRWGDVNRSGNVEKQPQSGRLSSLELTGDGAWPQPGRPGPMLLLMEMHIHDLVED